MWSLYNNALVKLNSDGYAQKSREVTGTIRSIMSSIPQNIRLGMFASDADPFPVRYKSFELFLWQGHILAVREYFRVNNRYTLKDN